MSLFDLRDNHALILAATSTLGSAMARGLAEHGARVSVVGRSLDQARALASEIEAAGGVVRAFAADATESEDIARLISEASEWGGPIHTFLHCAGVNSATPFRELEMAEWQRILDVNVGSVVRCAQLVSEHMIEHGQGGSLIHISSASAQVPLSRVFSYSASKAALENVTQFLARELAPHSIRVNAIVPGFFPAEQNRKILSKDRVTAILGHTPMARFGEPGELVGAAVWLASSAASSFVTGAMIRVDGGFGAMTI